MNALLHALASLYTLLADFNVCSILFRVFVATLLGSLIGLERERHGRAAGVRTHTLVCLGASMTVMVGLYANYGLGLSGDPLRVGAQVISGIGFLGAGTILTRHHSQITGLTTAAGLWTTAALGLSIGLGFYPGALIGFIAMEITIRMFSRRDQNKHTYEFYLELEGVLHLNDFTDQFASENVSIQIFQAKSGIPSNVGITMAVSSTEAPETLLQQLRATEHVVFAMPVK